MFDVVVAPSALRQLRRLLLTALLAGTPFLLWDLWATGVGHWSFDAEQTLPWRVADLPLEEVAFFIVIPVVAVLTFEAVGVARRRVRSADARHRGSRNRKWCTTMPAWLRVNPVKTPKAYSGIRAWVLPPATTTSWPVT